MDENASETPRASNAAILTRRQVAYIAQLVVLTGVIVCALYNISTKGVSDREIWITLLSSSLGYLLPNPKPTKR